MSKNQKGFSIVEGLLILIVVGLLGGIGWYIWDSNRKTDDSFNNANKSNNSVTDRSTKKGQNDETANWREERNTEFGYLYKYPETGNWERFLIKTELNSQAYSSGERINNTGVNYTGCGPNCGLAFSFSVAVKGSSYDVGANYVEQTQMAGNDYYKLESKTSVTRNGASGTRWEYKPGDGSSATIFFYYFTSSKYAFFMQINSNGAKTDEIDITERGEKIFSTFQFLN